MSTHNVCFLQEIRKIFILFGWKIKASYIDSRWLLQIAKAQINPPVCVKLVRKNLCLSHKFIMLWIKHSQHSQPKSTDVFSYFFSVKTCGGTSNEYTQHMFSLRNKKKMFIWICFLSRAVKESSRRRNWICHPLTWCTGLNNHGLQMSERIFSYEMTLLKSFILVLYSIRKSVYICLYFILVRNV